MEVNLPFADEGECQGWRAGSLPCWVFYKWAEEKILTPQELSKGWSFCWKKGKKKHKTNSLHPPQQNKTYPTPAAWRSIHLTHSLLKNSTLQWLCSKSTLAPIEFASSRFSKNPLFRFPILTFSLFLFSLFNRCNSTNRKASMSPNERVMVAFDFCCLMNFKELNLPVKRSLFCWINVGSASKPLFALMHVLSLLHLFFLFYLLRKMWFLCRKRENSQFEAYPRCAASLHSCRIRIVWTSCEAKQRSWSSSQKTKQSVLFVFFSFSFFSLLVCFVLLMFLFFL